MFWIVLVLGWLAVAPLAAWAVATSVALAESAPRPSMPDDTPAEGALEPAPVLEAGLVAAG